MSHLKWFFLAGIPMLALLQVPLRAEYPIANSDSQSVSRAAGFPRTVPGQPAPQVLETPPAPVILLASARPGPGWQVPASSQPQPNTLPRQIDRSKEKWLLLGVLAASAVITAVILTRDDTRKNLPPTQPRGEIQLRFGTQ